MKLNRTPSLQYFTYITMIIRHWPVFLSIQPGNPVVLFDKERAPQVSPNVGDVCSRNVYVIMIGWEHTYMFAYT